MMIAHSPPGTSPSPTDDHVARLRAKLEQLGADFVANVTAATQDYYHTASDAELAGMSAEALEQARQKAAARGLEGCLLTLDPASVDAALTSIQDRALRKSIYEAYSTRASDRGPRANRFDNTPLVSDILETRYELARALGHKNYAELALSDALYHDPDEVEQRLTRHHRATKARAQAELDELWAFAKEKGVPRGFSLWDLPFYAAWWRREKMALDEAELRPFFDFDETLEAALTLASTLLGLSFVRITEAAAYPAQRRYRVTRADGALLGVLALAPEDRMERGDDSPTWLLDAGQRTALLRCGFASEAGVAGIAFGEVAAIFRGVGAGSFLLLTHSGPTGAEPPSHDAILGSEVSGGYFERFASHFETVRSFAHHRRTRDELPRATFDALIQRTGMHAALAASQELELTLFDLRIHRDHVPRGKATQLRAQVLDTFIQIRREQSVLPASYWTRFANTACRIFSGTRAALLWERDFARHTRDELCELSAGAVPTAELANHLRSTFWAAEQRPLLTRLTSALGHAPSFGSR